MIHFEEKWKNIAENTKNTITILREVLLVVVLVLLILFPRVVNTRLLTAGFTKADIAGLHWESVQRASEQAGEASQQIQTANTKIDSVQKDLDTLAARTTNPEVKTEVNRLKGELEQSAQSTKNAETRLQNSLAIQESALQSARPQGAADTGLWGAVISSNKNLDYAEKERERVQQLGYRDTRIYYRDSWYRPVIVFPSVAEAQATLPTLRAATRDTAYLVEISKWCPTSEKTSQGILQCTGL